MNHPQLHAQLRRFAWRVRGVGGASGLGWGLAAMVAMAILGAWADLVLDLSPALRIGSLATAVLAGLGLTILVVRRAWGWAKPAALARRLDPIAGARGQITAGVDLLHDGRSFSPAEAGLAGIAIDRAAELASGVPGRRAVPMRPALISVLAAGALAAGVGFVVLVLPRLAQAQWLRFSDPFGDHPPYSAVVFRVEPGDLRVIYGQGAEIRATAEGPPVDRVELVLEPRDSASEHLAMFPEGAGRWRTAVANITSPGRYFVRAGRSRSIRHQIEVITVPRLTNVKFRVTPPAYTRRSAYEGPAPAGGLAGLAGTHVDIWATSNRPLAGGTLQLTTGHGTHTLELATTEGRSQEVHGSFDVRDDGKLEARVRDRAGQQSIESFTTAVALLPDDRPFIRITEPREVSFATPDIPLPVSVAAEDDYGIARVQLFRSLNGSRALPIDLSLGSEAPTRWSEQLYLPLGEYGLHPGDEITLFGRVEDTDPAGAKGSESGIVRIRIIPREVLERMLRAREGMEVMAAKYHEAERRLEALSDEMERLQSELAKLPPGGTLPGAAQAKLNELAKKFRDDTAAIRESARHTLPYDLDKNLSRELEALAKALDQAARAAEKLAGEPGLKNAAALAVVAELRQRVAGGRKELRENALKPLEHLAKIYPLFEDQARFVQLYLRQRDLAERTASLKGHDGEDAPALKARMRDLESEQKQMRTELSQLLDDIEDHAQRLPDDPRLTQLRDTAQAFAAAVRTSGASPAMAEAEAALAAFSGTRSSESTKWAADILEKFLTQCTGSGALAQACDGGLTFQPALAGNIGNSIEQMLAGAGFPSLGPGGQAGFGIGAGVGNGYSSQQNNINNVGLYGSLPTMVASSRPASGRSAAGAGSTRSAGVITADRAPDTTIANGPLRAAGQAQTAIPAPYRRRVADYFQRIADEIGNR